MELLLLRKLARRGVRNFFTLKSLRVFETKDANGCPQAEATVAVEVEGAIEHTAATGQGPVNAMDIALRKALSSFYPKISELSLRDFKVRVLTIGQERTSQKHDLFSIGMDDNPAPNTGTASVVRVLIESADPQGAWVTVGVSYDIIEASWQALADSVTYKLYRDEWQSHSNNKLE